MTDTDTPDREPPAWVTSPSAINDMARAFMLGSSDAVRYSSTVTVRCQPELTAAVARAARAKGTRPAEYVRQALLTGLRLDGFEPATIAPRDAGSLYNVTADGRHWALVIGDTVKTMHRAHDKPADEQGGVWLPIEYRDSEPFDPDRHWRLPYETTLEADRVVRTYPVVLKTLEAM